MLLKSKYAMNCAISRNRNSRLARLAHAFVIMPSVSSLPLIVPVALPNAMPGDEEASRR